MRLLHHVLIVAAVLSAMVGCATTHQVSPERQWQEGDIIHYTDGAHYQDSVSIAYPHYHVENGHYFETDQPSNIHFHVSRNPAGPKRYIRCFAEHHGGEWTHKPQWWEIKRKYFDRRNRY